MKKAKLSGEQMLTIKQRASNGNHTLGSPAFLLFREVDVTADQLCISDLAHCFATTEAEIIRLHLHPISQDLQHWVSFLTNNPSILFLLFSLPAPSPKENQRPWEDFINNS